MSGSICGGSYWIKEISYCPICNKKTRHIFACVFSGYGSNSVCGKCGSFIQDLERLHRGTKEGKLKYIQMVKDVWSGKSESFKGTKEEYFNEYGPGQLFEKGVD